MMPILILYSEFVHKEPFSRFEGTEAFNSHVKQFLRNPTQIKRISEN
jgi:hypothetical protein